MSRQVPSPPAAGGGVDVGAAEDVAAPASPPHGLRSRARTALIWSVVEKWGTRLGGLLVFVLLARLVAPEDFGVVAAAGTAVGLAGLLVEAGLGKYLIHVDRVTPAVTSSVFWTTTALGLVAALALAGTSGLLADAFGAPVLAPVMLVLGATVLVNSLGVVPIALLQRELDFRPVAVRRLAATAVSAVVAVVLALAGAGVWALVAQSAVASVVGTVVVLRATRFVPRGRPRRAEVRRATRYGADVLGIEVVTAVGRHADNVLVGLVLGPTALGFYVVGYRVLLILLEVLTSVTGSVALPLFAKVRDDVDRLQQIFRQVVQLGSLVAFPVFLGLAVVAPLLVPVLFGTVWEPSVPVMQWLAVAGLVQCLTYFDRPLLLAVGRTRTELVVTLVATAGNLVAFAVSVQHGIVAVAAAYAVRNLVFWPVRLLVLRSAGVPLRAYLGAVLPAAVAGAACAAAAAAVVAWVPLVAPLLLVLAVVAGGTAYVTVLRLVWPRRVQEVARWVRRR